MGSLRVVLRVVQSPESSASYSSYFSFMSTSLLPPGWLVQGILKEKMSLDYILANVKHLKLSHMDTLVHLEAMIFRSDSC